MKGQKPQSTMHEKKEADEQRRSVLEPDLSSPLSRQGFRAVDVFLMMWTVPTKKQGRLSLLLVWLQFPRKIGDIQDV